VGLDLRENVTEQCESPLAFETFEKGGQEDFGIVSFCQILKEVATALKQSQTPANARLKPEGVGECRAVATDPRLLEKTVDWSEKLDTDS
jgi:hypothetical protein